MGIHAAQDIADNPPSESPQPDPVAETAPTRKPVVTRRAWIAVGLAIGALITLVIIMIQQPSTSPVPMTPVTASPNNSRLPAPGLLQIGESTEVTFPGGAVLRIGTTDRQWFATGTPAPTPGNEYLVFGLDITHISGPSIALVPSDFTIRWLPANTPNASPAGVDGGHLHNPAAFGEVGPTTGFSGEVVYLVPRTEDVVLRLADDQGRVLARWAIPS